MEFILRFEPGYEEAREWLFTNLITLPGSAGARSKKAEPSNRVRHITPKRLRSSV
jgi:hypothetical protein